jgi:T5SS/PEP-CTERM-associated repeat protein
MVRSLCLLLFAGLCCALCPLPVRAAIVTTGDVDPADPAAWTSSTTGYVGNTSDGTMTVDLGSGVLSQYGYLGQNAGTSGTVTVHGVGSKWINGHLHVGDSGSGTLNIEAGGEVSNSTGRLGYSIGSSGTVTVNGVGSKWTNSGYLDVGYLGGGALNIEAGGEVSNRDGYLGNRTGSSGTATVSGAGSKWTNSETLFVGNSGSGTLNIEAGGEVSNVYGYLGSNTGSSGTATVTGAGSRWTDSYDLRVGNSGSGALNIEAGGEVSNRNGYLGSHPGSSGAATVRGTGSTWTNSGSLYVGNAGSGRLTVSDGGLVTAKTLYASLSDLVGNGTITAQGAVLDADLVFDATHGLQQTIAFGTGGTLNLSVDVTGTVGAGHRGNGTLRIADGVTVRTTSGYLGWHPGSSGTATVSGAGSTWTNSGSLYVGNAGNGKLIVSDGGLVTAKTLYASLSDLVGNGTITAQGAVLDADLVFDATHGLQQTIAFGTGGTLNLNLNVDGMGAVGAGYKGNGTLRIADGVTVRTTFGHLGWYTGSSGAAVVSGAGSKWISGALCIGNGMLNIEAGGQVSNNDGYLVDRSGLGCTATVTGTGSKWTNSGSLFVDNGMLNIEAGGEVSSNAGYLGGHSTATVRGVGSKWTNRSDLYVGDITLNVGDLHHSTLNIEAGGQVTSTSGYLGYDAGSSCVATVSGSGSKWINGWGLTIGVSGSGTLNIDAGGEVSSRFGSLGFGLSGTATVTGAGSKWTNSSTLYVGQSGKATLKLANGGAVTASAVSINSQSLLAIDATNGSRLTVNNGTGTITNNGTIRLLAGAGAIAGVAYTPVSAGIHSGSGGYQGVGGIWDLASRTLTPSIIETGTAGAPVSINLADLQRVKVSDATTDWALGASFLAKSASLTVTTTAIGGATRTALEPRIASDQSLRGGWQFATDSGYAAGEPAYLSFDLGAGYSRSALSVWRYDGTAWENSDAFDLTYDGRYASFTVTDLDTAGYAMAGTLRRAWGGGADGDDWSQGTNWNNAVGLMPTDNVVFDGTTRLTPNNDLENQQIGGLTFAAGAGAFHLDGNAVKVAGKVDDQAAVGQEIHMPVEFVAGPESGTVNVVEGGQLTMSQLVSGDQGLRKTGPGLLELIQDAAYSGDTLVEAGVLKMAGLSNSDSTTVGSATTTAELITSDIRQDTLTIHAGSKVTLSSTDWSMPAGGFASSGVDPNARAVPEPASWALLMLALLGGYVARTRNR